MEEMMSLQGIKHSFGQEVVLEEIHLSIKKGQIFGLLGPSGSGKTTLVKMIVGMIKPTKGQVNIQGVTMPSLEQMKQIGYMAQADALYNELTAFENLDFFSQIYGLSKQERLERIDKVLQIVDLEAHKQKQVDKFSGGMKRRLSLAAALLHQPSLLILDEPTVGIDPLLRESIWHNLEQLRKQGTTIIVTTHVMDEAEKCTRLALIRNGYVMAEGSPTEIKHKSKSSSMEEAFLHYGREQQ